MAWHVLANERQRVFGLLRVRVEGGLRYAYHTDDFSGQVTVTVTSRSEWKPQLRSIAFDFVPFSPTPQDVTIAASTEGDSATPFLHKHVCFSNSATCDKSFVSCSRADMLKVMDTTARQENAVFLPAATSITSDASTFNANVASTQHKGAYLLTIGISERPHLSLASLTDERAMAMEEQSLLPLQARIDAAEHALSAPAALAYEAAAVTNSIAVGVHVILRDMKTAGLVQLIPPARQQAFDDWEADEDEEPEIGGSGGSGVFQQDWVDWGDERGAGAGLGAAAAASFSSSGNTVYDDMPTRATLASTRVDAQSRLTSTTSVVHHAKVWVAIQFNYDDAADLSTGAAPVQPYARMQDILIRQSSMETACRAKEALVEAAGKAVKVGVNLAWASVAVAFAACIARYVQYRKESLHAKLASELGVSVLACPQIPYAETELFGGSDADVRIHAAVMRAVGDSPVLMPFLKGSSPPYSAENVAAILRGSVL